MTVREAISHGSSVLKNAGIESPSLDVSLLLAYLLNTTRTELIGTGPQSISTQEHKTFQELLERRINGECVAYIIGKKEFFGLEFLVNPSVLVPRPDTEILVSVSIEKKSTRILDLCTGSGAVAITLKHEMPNLEVHATDISAEALETAKTNAKRLLASETFIHFHHGDLFNALPTADCCPLFDLIVSNPPYIPTEEIKTLSPEVQKEPFIALDGGHSGLELIKKIIEKAPAFILPKGALLLEAAPSQMKKITLLLEKRGFKDIQLYKDLSGQDRVIGGVFG